MTEQTTSKTLHISLWVAQGLLAAAFGMAGFMKITAPIDQLVANGMSFVNHYDASTVRLIGISEVLGALGLVLPVALRIKPILTPIAAIALGIVMILATNYHISHGEPFIPTLFLLGLLIFVAWGRYKK